MQDSLNINELWEEVKADVMQRLEIIAETIEGKIAHKISNYKPYPIYDTGEFLNKLTHGVTEEDDEIVVRIWSDAKSPSGEKYAKFILGGRVPSDTPLKPLVAWVERKKLNWTDKSGKKMTAMQMAYLIRNKIRRVGVKERNVFQEVLNEEISWIESQLNKIQ